MSNYRDQLLEHLKKSENRDLYNDKNKENATSGVHPDPKKIATIGYGFNIGLVG